MKIRVRGSHGSDLLVKGPTGSTICRSVGFLVNDELMVDAGTLASGLTLEEQQRVKHILLSHLHLDHIKDIPPLQTVLLESQDGVGPYRIKGIGENSLGPVAPAIANAVEDAVGVRIKELPITAEKVYAALKEKRRDA